MKLTQKLLGSIYRAFNKDPKAYLALRVNYGNGPFTWTVQDGTLTGMSGVTQLFSFDLSQYTLGQLINALVAVPGVTVPYSESGSWNLSALVLLDATGDQSQSNGDHLMAYSSLLWALLEPWARELAAIATQIQQALLQMSLKTASNEWVDEWGGYFNVPRQSGELDAAYAARIIMEVLRPRGNNVAIEAALFELLGQKVTVTDLYTEPSQSANAMSPQVLGLFDVQAGYDLLGGDDINTYTDMVKARIETLRDAGMHLNSFSLVGSVLADSMPNDPSDSGSIIAMNVGVPITEPAIGDPTESASIHWTQATLYNGLRKFDGSITYSSGSAFNESLSG
ncbi:hypothetical protein [Burkholderia sp. Ac-20349]|uniref:hypothetical protein n=1 Tax=Burkholderia sp. Ac-20349 TaxID=2703893 RepID=UPI00197B4D45|nr:hypothetical protein [Burkholderia sp. Ac-20349]MBN3839265.1 hypothetical protein [Burkholderia sp. Ac-20349]